MLALTLLFSPTRLRRRNFATTYVFSLLLLKVITMLDIDTAHHVPAT